MGRNALVFIDLLYNIANVDCNVERSGNDGGLPRLEPGLRDKMLCMSGVDPKALRNMRPSFSRRFQDVSSSRSEQVYRVTIKVVSNLPLTPKQRLRFSTWASYQNGTFVLMSTGVLTQPEWSPCTLPFLRYFLVPGVTLYTECCPVGFFTGR